MKFIVAILTSYDSKSCKLTYETIINQNNNNLDYSIFIIVNSKNKNYFKEINNEFTGIDVKIIETFSNGYPGKGHNSVLNVFKNETIYDYCILIDSSDLFYPNAFVNLEYYLNYNPDMLFICYHDHLSFRPSKANAPYICVNSNCFINYNIHDITTKLWYENKGKNPFTNNINNLNTPGRPILFSRKSLEYDIYYDENMKLYDDFIVFIKAFEHSFLKKLNIFGIIDSDIYLYNTLDINRVTFKYSSCSKDNDRIEENNNFIKSIKNKYLAIRDWNLIFFPKLSLGQFTEHESSLVNKIKYITNIIKKINLDILTDSNDNCELILKYAMEKDDINLYNEINQVITYNKSK